MKIANIDRESLQALKDFKNCKEFFRKYMAYNNSNKP